MYNHFVFPLSTSNPYITTTPARFWYMLKKYALDQYAAHMFYAYPRERNGSQAISYRDAQDILRNFAIQWQARFNECSYSYSDMADWGAFFEEYGRKYGLLREFRENGIL